MRERAKAKRLFTLRLEQRNEAKVAIGRVQRVQHDAFDLAPFALNVIRREHKKSLAACSHTALHLLDARRAASEITEVNEGPQANFFDYLQQFAAHPLLVM